MTKIAAPFSYFGGKAGMAAWIIRHFPAHDVYVEPFGGSAAVMMAKIPVGTEIYNDVDDGVVGFYRVLRDPTQFADLLRRVQLTPYSRRLFDEWRQNWWSVADPVERAARWFYVIRASFSANMESWSFGHGKKTSGGMETHVGKWIAAWEALPAFHQRWLRVVVEQSDWSDLVDRYDAHGVLWYMDPPYEHATRVSGRYRHEFWRADHERLVERVLTMRGMVALSGYDHAVYAPLREAGWAMDRLTVPLHAKNAAKHQSETRIECLWLNPAIVHATPRQLTWEEDIAYVGPSGPARAQPAAERE